MSKDVQMSIKMESELRDQFMAVASDRHRPAAQIIRDLMRLYIADSMGSKTPNKLTADTIRKGRKGEDIFTATDASSLFKQLGI
jgi:predicted DNA-binding protein